MKTEKQIRRKLKKIHKAMDDCFDNENNSFKKEEHLHLAIQSTTLNWVLSSLIKRKGNSYVIRKNKK